MKEPCEQCGKPHDSEDRELYLDHRQKRLDDAKGNLTLVRAKVAQQASEALRLQSLAAAWRARVPDVTAVNVERHQLKTEMDKFDQFVKGSQVAKTNLTAARTALATRQSEVNPFESVVSTLQGQIARDGAELAALVVGSDAAREKLELANHVVKVFGPAGVRAQILDTVTPFLNDRTGDYLSALTDGGITATWSTLTKAASGDLKEKFSIEVTSATGGESFLSLSGGEKRKVRLATALALQDLVASRATQSIDLFIADEVDAALDTAGLERLMVLLERRARVRGTVIVISHSDLADWCDNITTVRKTGSYSVVEGSLCV
jgi:DNA repair exonuclease SbcCD ATPase subunit